MAFLRYARCHVPCYRELCVTCTMPQPLRSNHVHLCISFARCAIQSDQHLVRSCRTKLQAEDVQVGPHKEEYLHTLIGGSDDKVPVVIMPGYGAGSGFWFR